MLSPGLVERLRVEARVISGYDRSRESDNLMGSCQQLEWAARQEETGTFLPPPTEEPGTLSGYEPALHYAHLSLVVGTGDVAGGGGVHVGADAEGRTAEAPVPSLLWVEG